MQDNIFIIITALGGLGLFLLGMIVMTAGLRELAGDAIRTALMRFTHTPSSGALTGATCTAILQSSSATTVAAVGFVAAGLMSFTSALGIVFGANLGTTVTGWLVALIGFKLKIGLLAMPMVLVGAILRLFGSGKLRSAGFALAGFGPPADRRVPGPARPGSLARGHRVEEVQLLRRGVVHADLLFDDRPRILAEVLECPDQQHVLEAR